MWRLLIGLVLLSISILLFFLAYKIGWKYMLQEDRCTAKTTGRIVGYSMWRHGNSALRLPKVEYETNQGVFTMTGPEYRSVIVSSVSTPFRKQQETDYTTDIYAQSFRCHIRKNSLFSVEGNPMRELFPLGSEIDVFYDPYNPQLAYALRYANKKFVFYLLLFGGLLLLAASIIVTILLFNVT